jgi:hypothetical protein
MLETCRTNTFTDFTTATATPASFINLHSLPPIGEYDPVWIHVFAMKVYESTKPMLPDHKRLAYDQIDWTYTIHDMGLVGKMKVNKLAPFTICGNQSLFSTHSSWCPSSFPK